MAYVCLIIIVSNSINSIFNQLTDTKSLFFKNSCLKSARFLKVFYLLDLFLRLFFN